MVAAKSLRVVLYEGAGAAPLENGRRFEITRTLLEKGYGVTRCREGGKVSDAAASGTLLVLGQFDGAADSLETAGDAPLQMIVREIATLDPPQVLELVNGVRTEIDM